MSRDFGQGIFDMEFINSIAAVKDLTQAKAKAFEKIESTNATDENKAKAKSMVSRSATLSKLLFGMTNFSLSHQGLKAI